MGLDWVLTLGAAQMTQLWAQGGVLYIMPQGKKLPEKWRHHKFYSLLRGGGRVETREMCTYLSQFNPKRRVRILTISQFFYQAPASLLPRCFNHNNTPTPQHHSLPTERSPFTPNT